MGRKFQAERCHALSKGVELLMGPSLQSILKAQFAHSIVVVFFCTALVVIAIPVGYLIRARNVLKDFINRIRRSK